jgi:hypothetical protein
VPRRPRKYCGESAIQRVRDHAPPPRERSECAATEETHRVNVGRRLNARRRSVARWPCEGPRAAEPGAQAANGENRRRVVGNSLTATRAKSWERRGGNDGWSKHDVRCRGPSPNVQGNRRAAPMVTENQSMCRRVRLTVGLGPSVHDSERIAKGRETARSPMLRLAAPGRSTMRACERALHNVRYD